MTTNTDTQAHGGGVEAVPAEDIENIVRGLRSGGVNSVVRAMNNTAASVIERLAASPAAPAPAAGVDAQFTALRIAYKRGVAWAIENPGANSSWVEKAAYDYADKATAPDAKGER